MKPLLILLSGLLLSAGFAESKVEHRTASDSYTAPEVNVSFPADIGSFRKNEVSRSYNPMIGTKIRYSDPEGFCADVYIYSLPDGKKEISPAALKKHYDELKQAILALSSQGLSLKNVTLSGEKTENRSGLQVYSANFQLVWSDGKTQESSLTLFAYKGQIIKLRVSSAKENANLFADAIIKLFPKI